MFEAVGSAHRAAGVVWHYPAAQNEDRADVVIVAMIILLVEDDPAQLEPLHAALSQAGHIVDGIEDGETAQWLMSQKDYDLLILD